MPSWLSVSPARSALFVTLAAFALLVIILAGGLRPDAFFAGDPGVKLIAARNAIQHPAHPLAIPLPEIGGSPVPFVEPFFAVHGDHSHAVTSDLFPLISAPLLALAGVRGVYVLPALGFLLAIAACGWIGVQLDPRRSAAGIAAVAGLTTPLLFYGLEFWEHAPAVGLAAAATAILIHSTNTDHTEANTSVRAFASGVLFGAATLLRPEAGWFALAVVACSPLLPRRPNARTLFTVAIGALVAIAPYAFYSIVHVGRLLPIHVATNAGLLSGDWTGTRLSVVAEWFLKWDDTSFWKAAPIVWLATMSWWFHGRGCGRTFLWAVAVLYIALIVLTAPNTGGGQWGPRYLLFAYIPLTALAADAIQITRLEGTGTAGRPGSGKKAGAIALAVVVLAAGAWTLRSAYRSLRGTKAIYGRLVDFIDADVPPGGYVVTDVWWLDQVAAATQPSRQFLFVPDTRSARDVMRMLDAAHVAEAVLIRSTAASDTEQWSVTTCFSERDRVDIADSGLVATRFACGRR